MRNWWNCQFDPTQKPEPGVAEIDWTHPLADRLFYFSPFDEGAGGRVRDMAGGLSLRPTGSASWVNGRNGFGYKVTGSNYLTVTSSRVTFAGGSGITIVIRADWSLSYSASGWKRAITFDNGSAWQHGVQINNTGLVQFGVNVNGGAFTQITSSLPSRQEMLTFVCDKSTTLRGYYDGALKGTGTVTAPTSFNATSTMNLGSIFGIGDSDFTPDYVGLFARGLTAAEAAWLAAEPYAMLRPVMPHRVYSFPGSPFFYRRYVLARGAA